MRRGTWTSTLIFLAVACARPNDPSVQHGVRKVAPQAQTQTRTKARLSVETLLNEPLTAPIDTGAAPRSHVNAGADGSSGGKSASGSMWGDEVGEGFGAGGLGLSGVGEGGGGKGIGLGSVGTIGHGAGSRRDLTSAEATEFGMIGMLQQGNGVRSGEWDDNANFREFTKWLAAEPRGATARLDLSSRRFVVVKDSAGKPVPGCRVLITSATHALKELSLITQSSGRALFFPYAEGFSDGQLRLKADCAAGVAEGTLSVKPGDDVVALSLSQPRDLPATRTVDVAFVLDTTGSMGEEIAALTGTLDSVAQRMPGLGVTFRVALVEYKDRGDAYITRLHQMTTDLPGLSKRISAISASGGGDTPEHVNAALWTAANQVKWSSKSVAHLMFLIGDAPPHLDYQNDHSYADTMRTLNHTGVQLYTIAASGMDDVGQVVWRQLAQYTGGTNLFVLRGGAGPQSKGAGDPKSSCGGRHKNYASGNLGELINEKLRGAVAALDADPLLIAGLQRDEKAKPCSQRIAVAQRQQ